MEVRVSSFGSRQELEAYCERLDAPQKEGLSITGTLEELAHFQLGAHTRVHGIPCVASDFDYKQAPEKPERAAVMPGSIAGTAAPDINPDSYHGQTNESAA